LSPVADDLEQEVNPFEQPAEPAAPAGADAEAVAVADAVEREHGPDWDEDCPVEREVETGRAAAGGEQRDRGRPGRRCEWRVLEHVEGDHPRLSFSSSSWSWRRACVSSSAPPFARKAPKPIATYSLARRSDRCRLATVR
jgi:hypothetical protein